MVRFAGPQVGVFPMLWRQPQVEPVIEPMLEMERVSAKAPRPPMPLDIDLSSLTPPGKKPLKRSGACIGEQNEYERQQAARCVVEGGRTAAGPADIYLRHSTALVLQENEGHTPASARHEVVGVVLGRERRYG